MSNSPSLAAEMGRAVALGRMPLAIADCVLLARNKSLDDARVQAAELRSAAASWRHIRDALQLRISTVAREQIKAKAPKNVILALAHEVNRSQTLTEAEVNQIVIEQVYEALPSDSRTARRGR